MNVVSLAARNVLRNRTRTILTVLGVAVAIVAFVLLRTVVTAWNVAVDYAAKDRVATRHKVSFVMTLPKRYIDTIRGVRGVRAATWANWFGARDPRNPDSFFANFAVDHRSYLDVFDEMQVPPADVAAWKADRRGAIVGDVLARSLGVRKGDRLTLEGTIFPGNWEFNIRGIYTATRRSVDRSQLIFHWDYLNESLPESRRDQIGWTVARIDDPSRAAEISRAIDRTFDSQDVQTLSMSERQLNNSFMAMFDTLLDALDIISIIILAILLLLLGNTIAMGVRERTNEYGVLRALGFLPRHVVTFIVGEAVVLGLIAGVAGIGLSYPVVEYGLGRFLEENMGGFFPYFRIEPTTTVAAMGLAVFLGVVASLVPAFRASRLTVTDALRRLD
ncbi:MAG: ABC transporter permease [Deltaproteobacteria bacterium]|nr:ABC transporter permease [Deltaproteobacteria bacterium]